MVFRKDLLESFVKGAGSMISKECAGLGDFQLF